QGHGGDHRARLGGDNAARTERLQAQVDARRAPGQAGAAPALAQDPQAGGDRASRTGDGAPDPYRPGGAERRARPRPGQADQAGFTQGAAPDPGRHDPRVQPGEGPAAAGHPDAQGRGHSGPAPVHQLPMSDTVARAKPDEELFSIARRVGERLRARKETVAVAESCTGGLLGAALTDVPGSSAYFLGGVISYADAVKLEQLGVPDASLRQYGSVSEQTAAAMASGVRQRLHADVGVSVTGVAGPDAEGSKPVGLTFIGIATPTLPSSASGGGES